MDGGGSRRTVALGGDGFRIGDGRPENRVESWGDGRFWGLRPQAPEVFRLGGIRMEGERYATSGGSVSGGMCLVR